MIVNHMPGVVRVYRADRPDGVDDLDQGLLHTFDPEPQAAQIDPMSLVTTVIEDDVALELVEFGHVDNLDSEREGVFHVVPLEVALSQRRRTDLLVPRQEVTTSDGTVIGYRTLAQPV